jgi:hypothetical protein
MQKMKSMPGMGDLQSMLAKMGMGHMMPGGNSGGKVNMNAMKSNLDRNLKAAKNKERLLSNLEKRKSEAAAAAAAEAALQQQYYLAASASAKSNLHSAGLDQTGLETLIFSKGEQVERSSKSSESVAVKSKNKNKKKK